MIIDETKLAPEEAKTAKNRNVDPWKVMQKIRLPRKAHGEEGFEFVGVNGKQYQVPCGKEVEVPLPIYKRLQIMLAARDKLEDDRAEIPHEGI